jgi:hypothetical protein
MNLNIGNSSDSIERDLDMASSPSQNNSPTIGTSSAGASKSTASVSETTNQVDIDVILWGGWGNSF